MEQKLTAQDIVERLIDEQKISGKEAVILLNAINKPIEKECSSYTPHIVSWGQENAPKCYEPGGLCTNPHMDCVNCPRTSTGSRTYIPTISEIPNPVEPMMKEE